MKLIRSRLLIAALAVLFASAVARSQTADAAPPAPPMHNHEWGGHKDLMEFFARYLNLTDEQKTQMKAVLHKEHASIKPLMQQLHQSEAQLKQYELGAYDEAKVRPLAAQEAQTRIELRVQEARIHSELFQLLTPEQQTKMKEFEANREARFQKHMQSETPAAPEQ